MSDWSARADGTTDPSAAPFKADWVRAGVAERGFSHFTIRLDVWTVTADRLAPDACWWSDDPEAEGLTTLLRRVLDAASAGPSPA